MGQEIRTSHFDAADFREFGRRLREETELLARVFASDGFSHHHGTGGFELEAWLVDPDWRAAPANEEVLASLSTDWVTPELARFNIEVNVDPADLGADGLARLAAGLKHNWDACRRAASAAGCGLVAIGILPSLREEELTVENMSRLERYRALNEQVLKLRAGRELELDIVGREHLRTRHRDVMLEAAATSFQVHLQLDPRRAARYYNASVLASAFTVAAAGNSPYLFGRDLWCETRIPLFEQAVNVGGFEAAAFGPVRRVGFGHGYVRESLLECFLENLEHYPPLLPMVRDEDPARFSHLRLHNGTIWRWNRPLIGFDPDGRPHLRIEHRVLPGGPSLIDMMANAALYFGLASYLAQMPSPPESELPFDQARDNFYHAARLGLDAQLHWLDGRREGVGRLLAGELIAMAEAGLGILGADPAHARELLGVVRARVESGRTGAVWQRRWVAAHGRDWVGLTAAYAERQASGDPVHEWGL